MSTTAPNGWRCRLGQQPGRVRRSQRTPAAGNRGARPEEAGIARLVSRRRRERTRPAGSGLDQNRDRDLAAAGRRRRVPAEAGKAGDIGGGWSHAQPGPQIVEAEWIGQGQSVAPRFGRLGGVKDLVKDPGGDQQAEDKALVGEADEHREDEHVGQRLDELAVVHGAYPGNKAQQAGQHGMRMQAGQAGVGRRRRPCERQPGRQAGFAVDHASYRTHARGAQWLAAVLAIGRSRNIGMVRQFIPSSFPLGLQWLTARP